MFYATKLMMQATFAKIYFKGIIKLHGVHKTIVSNQDSKFLSSFWRSLWNLLSTKLSSSITYHPQTDGETKVTNETFNTLHRSLVSKRLKDWDLELPILSLFTIELHLMLHCTHCLSLYIKLTLSLPLTCCLSQGSQE